MNLQSPHALLPLPHHRPQRLTNARGMLLRARRGAVWITVDHDPRDIVLRAGQQWVVDSSRPVILSSLGKSALVELCDARLHRRQQRHAFWEDVLRVLRDRDARPSLAAAPA